MFFVLIGVYIGCLFKDKYVVCIVLVEELIWWDNNKFMVFEVFDVFYVDMLVYMKGKDYFVQDLFGGVDLVLCFDVCVVIELVWYNLFICYLLCCFEVFELVSFVLEFIIINCFSFKVDFVKYGCCSEIVIVLNFDCKLILIGGIVYVGENKKFVFMLLNYILLEKGVMLMYCLVNYVIGNFDDSVIFFGLLGIGKIMLLVDLLCVLIGDDEYGWLDYGIFNFEGGCYVKMINLLVEVELEIFVICSKFGIVIENMVYDFEMLVLDFEDNLIIDNMCCVYLLDQILNVLVDSFGGMFKNVIMLICDVYGVLLFIVWLILVQVMYYFLLGFILKMLGMEVGVVELILIFLICFGVFFMLCCLEVYGKLLQEKIKVIGVNCWLVNIGWIGGVFGIGKCMLIKVMCVLLIVVLDGLLNDVQFCKDLNFGFEVLVLVFGVDEKLLDLCQIWVDVLVYDVQVVKLVGMFSDNFV